MDGREGLVNTAVQMRGDFTRPDLKVLGLRLSFSNPNLMLHNADVAKQTISLINRYILYVKLHLLLTFISPSMSILRGDSNK
jgi:hypothetical protein